MFSWLNTISAVTLAAISAEIMGSNWKIGGKGHLLPLKTCEKFIERMVLARETISTDHR